MTTEEIILSIFWYVDEHMNGIAKPPQAKLWPSAWVTIGRLAALKGGRFRAVYRWLKRDYDGLFGGLPDRTRLQRALNVHQDWCERLLAEPSLFTVIDNYPIELIFPIREGRSREQVGGKSKDKGRWTVGIRRCWILNDHGQVVDWAAAPLNTSDPNFHPMIAQLEDRSIVLTDLGFRSAQSLPSNLKLCPKGTWHERMLVETALSMVTLEGDLKHLHPRASFYILAHLACVTALFNVLLALFHQFHPAAAPFQMSFAEFPL